MSDEHILQEIYNVTIDDVWYFAPRTQPDKPYNMAICLIWTPPYKIPLNSLTAKVTPYNEIF